MQSLSELLPMSEIDGSDVFKEIENARFHRRAGWVRGHPDFVLRSEEGDEEEEARDSDQHGC